VPIPIVPGHEYVGVIEESGSNVEGYRVGERVLGEAIIPCDKCIYCRTGSWQICLNRKGLGITSYGSMSEYVAVPETVLHKLPDGLEFPVAVIAQPFAVGIHGVERLGRGGEKVAIFGFGSIGLGAALACKESGASVVVFEIDKRRIEIAKEFDIEAVNLNKVYPETVLKRITGKKEGFDVVIECSGAQQAINDSLRILKIGGTLIQIGIPADDNIAINLATMVRKEQNLNCSYSAKWYSYERALDICFKYRYKLEKIITAYPLQRVNEAFEAIINKKGNTIKNVIIFD
jgi:2-desacetyl-2-hydroxyethyl bacteriochlorophyllide A dehydrogenase